MFRWQASKPFGQALRPGPAEYRRPARRLWRLHGRGLHPQTPGRAKPSPATTWTASSGPLPSCRPGRKGPLDANGVRVARSAAAGGTVAAIARSQAHDAGRDVPTHTAAHCAPDKPVFAPAGPPATAQAATPMPQASPGTPRRLSAWGYRKPKAAQATGAKRRMAEVRGRVRPLGRASYSVSGCSSSA